MISYTFVHMKSQKLFKDDNDQSYGGELLKKRKGRSKGRPLAIRKSMHLVLRSTKAVGPWSFKDPDNRGKIKHIVDRFAKKYGVRVLSRANVGNHLHFHIQLTNRHTYRAFIRAITAAIAMAVTGASRWLPLNKLTTGKFWDYRPFTRIVQGFRDFLGLNKYIKLNQLEGCGYTKAQARYLLTQEWSLGRAPPG